MKKLLINIMLLCSCMVSYAQNTTTDHLVLSEATLAPGGEEVKVKVSLQGSTIYSGFNMDIRLPEGIEMNYYNGKLDIQMDRSDGMYPSITDEREGTTTYTHSVSATYGVVGKGILRVACISTQNDKLLKTSGSLFTIYLKAKSFAKPGAAEIALTGLNLTTAEAVKYVPKDEVSTSISVSSNATAPIAVSSTNKWGTCILPFESSVPTGVKAYSVGSIKTEDEKDYIVLNPESKFDAYTPYIIYAENGYSGDLTGTVDASLYPEGGYVSEGYLNGAVVARQVSNGYVLQNLDDGVKFYSCNGEMFSIPAGKCWLTLPNTLAKPKGLGFIIEDALGIENVTSKKEISTATFSLTGQRVETPHNERVYIMNGKKIYKR